jgi:cytochrome c biogenesis protein CcmG/thiol:disulfide interchange protein DsbE
MSPDFSAASTNSSECQASTLGGRAWRTRWILFVPLGAFVVIGATFYLLLGRDPHLVASPLIGRPVPQFSLPAVKGRELGLSSADLKGEVSLVNVFASWCVACREEHPVLMQLHDARTVTVHGLNYKDAPDAAARWLDTMGDPYTRTGADRDGSVAMDWGVYGVPETFVIDAQGRIVHKQIGPITAEVLQSTILPLIRKLRENAQARQ